MYSVYKYPAGVTAANILADVVALLTGETNPANLAAVEKTTQASTTWENGVGSGFSGLTPDALIGRYLYVAGVRKGQVLDNDATTVTIDDGAYDDTGVTAVIAVFEIYTSWHTSAWSMHDASAGTKAICLKAVIDDPTKYAYVVLDVNSDGYIMQKTYEAWNAEAHTGTNMAYNSNSTAYSQRINTTSGGYLYISSYLHMSIHSYQSSVWGNSGQSSPTFVFQRSRDGAADTIANGYPPFFFAASLSASTRIWHPRMLKANGEDSLAQAFFGYCRYGTIASLTALISPAPNKSDKTVLYPLMPMWVTVPAEGHAGGEFSSLSETYAGPYGYGSPLDELIYDSNKYVLWGEGNYRYAVRKG